MPQGTILGPLFLNLQSVDMAARVDNETKRIQYAEDNDNLILIPPLTKQSQVEAKCQKTKSIFS